VLSMLPQLGLRAAALDYQAQKGEASLGDDCRGMASVACTMIGARYVAGLWPGRSATQIADGLGRLDVVLDLVESTCARVDG